MKTATALLLVSLLSTQLLVPAVTGGYAPRQECHTEYETVTSYEEQCSTSYEQQCSTEHEQQCSTSYEKQCSTSHEQQCSTAYEQKCSTIYEDQCSTSYEKECSTSYEEQCSTSYQQKCSTTYEDQCSTTYEHVCSTTYEQECSTSAYGSHSKSCRQVPKESCKQVPRQSCQQVPRESCHQEPRQNCQQVPKETCKQVPKQNCHKVPKEVCQQVPKQNCHQVPKESCHQVPKQNCHQVPKTLCKDVPRQSCTSTPVHKKVAKEVCFTKSHSTESASQSHSRYRREAVQVASLSPSTDSNTQVDWQTYSLKALASPLAVQSRRLDAKSPSAKAALSYLQGALGLDSCGQQAKVYLETILGGGSPAQANAEATAVYIRNYNAGERAAPGSACAASDIAFRQAAAAGEDPVLAAALAFMKSYGSDSPCFVAARDYVESVVAGASQTQANVRAAKSFAHQLQTLAAQRKPTIDEACAASAKVFASFSDSPSSPNAAAMQAFISKALETREGFDPVCYASAEKFFESFESGKPEIESTFAAARDFLAGYRSSPTPASQSPCAAATKAYAVATKNSPSAPSQRALLAFVDEAVFTKDDGLDPVCGASAEAYFNTYLTGAGEAAASEAAAVAYLEAVDANPGFDLESPCGRAARAYIATFE